MKIKDIDLSKYVYKRICVATERGELFLPEHSENALVALYGENEISEEGITLTESGWLCLKPEKQ